ncbi:serine threonine specific protein phosphatase, partial [Cystoisospora suis]
EPESSPAAGEEDVNASTSSDLGVSKCFGSWSNDAARESAFNGPSENRRSAPHHLKTSFVLVSVDSGLAADSQDVASLVHGSISVDRGDGKAGGKGEDTRDPFDTCPGLRSSEEVTRTLFWKEVLRASRDQRGGLRCEDGNSYSLSQVEALQQVNGAQFVSFPPGVLSIEPGGGREGLVKRRLPDESMPEEYEPEEVERSADGNFWRAAIPLVSSGIEADASEGPEEQSSTKTVVQPGDLVVILCLGSGSGLVAVPPDYARMLAGNLRGPWTHRVTVQQAWLGGKGGVPTGGKQVMRTIISDSERKSSEEDDDDDAAFARQRSTPIFVSVSFSQPKETDTSYTEVVLPLPVGSRCLLMGLRKQFTPRRYAVKLKCGEHELRHALRKPSRSSRRESAGSTAKPGVFKKLDSFLGDALDVFVKIYLVSAAAMFGGHFLSKSSPRHREIFRQRLIDRPEAVRRIGWRLLPFMSDQDFVDYYTAQKWKNIKLAADYGRTKDTRTGVGFLMGGGGLFGVNTAADLFFLTLALYLLNKPVKWVHGRWRRWREKVARRERERQRAQQRAAALQRWGERIDCLPRRRVVVFCVNLAGSLGDKTH